MKSLVIVTTVGTEEQAISIARELVARRQAACVNILPGVRSVYRWQSKICTDGEWMLMIKSADSEFDAVSASLHELHDYDLPEILAFEVVRGDADFLNWIGGSLDKDADFGDEEEDDDDSAFIDLGKLVDRVL